MIYSQWHGTNSGMLSYLERRLLPGKDPWNRKSMTLVPEDKKQPRSAILIHGFMGSPFDVKPLGLHLLKMGYKVVIPVVPGQTCETPVLLRRRYSGSYYREWLQKIVKKETNETGKKPFLAGFSMGGALSAIIAAGDRVEKLVLIAPFFKLPRMGDGIWRMSRKLSPLIPFVPKLSKGRINCKSGYRDYTPGSYFISLAAFNTLGDLAAAGRKAAGNIKVPVLVVISNNDQVADSNMTKKLFDGMPNIDFVYENRANHILLHDHGADDIVSRIGSFFRP